MNNNRKQARAFGICGATLVLALARGMILSKAKSEDSVPTVVWQSNDDQSRLYQGDSLELMATLPAESVDCIWTDPPYNLSNDGVTCVAGRMVKVNKGEWDRSRGVELDHEFNKTWLAACYRLLKPTGTIWVSGTAHVYPS